MLRKGDALLIVDVQRDFLPGGALAVPDFASGLELPPATQIIDKATTAEKGAYSAFEGTDLKTRLAELGVRRLFIGGLATEYCVAANAEDALRSGYDVVLLTDAVRAIDSSKGREAIESLRRKHAAVADCGEVLHAPA